jgi:phosphoesterase RecJ-like protein
MTYRTPESRSKDIDAVLEALQGCETAVLTTHINSDGDGLGSEVALAAWLREKGTEAFIVNPTSVPTSLDFLVPDPAWVLDAGSSKAVEMCAAADVAVVLDTGEVSRIGRVKPLINGIPTVVVDHHPRGDQAIGGVSFRDSTACATGELVYDIILAGGGPWSPEGDLAMYVAILTDTGSFRFSNVTPASHSVVAELIRRGVRPEEAYRRVYGTAPHRRLMLLRSTLGELEIAPEGGVAWMTVPSDEYDRLGATTDDLEGLVDYPRSVDGVEVGLLFRTTAKGGTKISFRSNGDVDVNQLARRFGGGGHVRASGALVDGSLEDVRNEVVTATIAAVGLLDAKG